MFLIFVVTYCCLLRHVTTLYLEDDDEYYSNVLVFMKVASTL